MNFNECTWLSPNITYVKIIALQVDFSMIIFYSHFETLDLVFRNAPNSKSFPISNIIYCLWPFIVCYFKLVHLIIFSDKGCWIEKWHLFIHFLSCYFSLVKIGTNIFLIHIWIKQVVIKCNETSLNPGHKLLLLNVTIYSHHR